MCPCMRQKGDGLNETLVQTFSDLRINDLCGMFITAECSIFCII